jgi:hypothetical protein
MAELGNQNIVNAADNRFFGQFNWTYKLGGNGENTYTRTYDAEPYNGAQVTGPGIDCSHLLQKYRDTSRIYS